MKAELESLVEQMINHGILFDEAVKEFEKKFIITVVDRNNNNLSKAACELGIHRNTLSKRLIEYQKSAQPAPSRNGHKRKTSPPKRKSKK